MRRVLGLLTNTSELLLLSKMGKERRKEAEKREKRKEREGDEKVSGSVPFDSHQIGSRTLLLIPFFFFLARSS